MRILGETVMANPRKPDADKVAVNESADSECSEGPGLGVNANLVALVNQLEAEIDRLRINLDNLRLAQSQSQRELIRRQVAAIDERQDALADLKRLVRQAAAADASNLSPEDTDSVH